MQKKMWLVLVVMWLYNVSYGQLLLDTEVQQSQYANAEKTNMVLVDFWATWCGPCVYASQYLNDLQQMFPDELYIVSLSNEDLSKVEQFIKKHPVGLNVSIDEGKSNFDKYNVQSLPYSVLLDASGQIIWSGNPTNLKPEIVRKLSAKLKTPIYPNHFIKYSNRSKNIIETHLTEDVPVIKDYKISTLQQAFEADEAIIEKVGNYTIVYGGLRQILAYLLMANPLQIEVPYTMHKTIKLVLNDLSDTLSKADIAIRVLSDAGMQLKPGIRKGEVLKLDFEGSFENWWDKNSIQWGSDLHQAFLVTGDGFKADDIDFETFIYKLSEIKGIPVVFDRTIPFPKGVYDWDFHYRYYDLMAMNLERLGISSQITEAEYPVYVVESLYK